jgi:hypothetical protein
LGKDAYEEERLGELGINEWKEESLGRKMESLGSGMNE